jgi:hypothetical protein
VTAPRGVLGKVWAGRTGPLHNRPHAVLMHAEMAWTKDDRLAEAVLTVADARRLAEDLLRSAREVEERVQKDQEQQQRRIREASAAREAS